MIAYKIKLKAGQLFMDIMNSCIRIPGRPGTVRRNALLGQDVCDIGVVKYFPYTDDFPGGASVHPDIRRQDAD